MAKKRTAKKKPKPAAGELAFIAEDLRPLAVEISGLTLDPRNARKHDEGNLSAIAASLRQFGQVKPIVVNRDTKIIEAGNGTFLAAQTLGWSHLAVVFVEHDAAAARGYAIADNRTAELATWDDEMLAGLLEEMQTDSPDLYNDLLLDGLLSSGVDEPAEPKETGPPTGTYQMIVECPDEKDRERLLNKLRKEGRQCHAVTWS